jgi:hypothetical protein
VSAVLVRLRDWFLVSNDAVAQRSVVRAEERAAPSAVAALCAPGEAARVGRALGSAAAARAGTGCAIVCRWTGEEPDDVSPPAPGPPVAGAARRVTTRLRGRGLAATARGRLVTVALAAGGVEARAQAERAAAAAGDVPVVLVLAGPRPAAFDPLLAQQDRIVVVAGAGAPAALEALALDDAARLGRATGVLRVGPPAPAWLGGRASLRLRAAAAAVLDGHA